MKIMAENDSASIISDIINPDMQMFLQEGLSDNSKNDDKELRNTSELSHEVEMRLAYLSEKIANLENLLLQVLVVENDIGSFNVENDDISSELVEKAFTFDLLYAMLNVEIREVDDSLSDLQDLIVDALRKISTNENSTELLSGLLAKLRDSEELLKQSQECVLEMKIQLAKLQMNSTLFKKNEWKRDLVTDVREEISLESKEWKPEIQAVEHRHVLRMLEKSLARELELEKKLMESRQEEENLKVKIHLLEQVTVCIEEAAEATWNRFLEADNTGTVLMGISKEMIKKSQINSSDVGNLTKREEEINFRLQDSVKQLSEKESIIRQLNTSISHLMAENAEVKGLREKVRVLEEKLETSESQLKEVKSSNEIFQNQIKEMDSEIKSLRENLHASEIRAAGAEDKVTHLMETNMELTEEIDFLKGSNDSNSKKVSVLENQLRELDVQYQNTRASSEASLEQQNMLYTAIWDMETLIDELKQKVSKAESHGESVEVKNKKLSEKNEELETQFSFARARTDIMEASLNQADLQKSTTAKDISLKTNLIIDTLKQLTMERELVHKQVMLLIKENKSLREKLKKVKKNSFTIHREDGIYNERDKLSSLLDSGDYDSAKTSEVKGIEISSNRFQVETLKPEAVADANEPESSTSAIHSTNSIEIPEKETPVKTVNNKRIYTFIAILVVLLSILAARLLRLRIAVTC